MSLFKKELRKKHICVLDVGSGSVGVVVAKLQDQKKPEIIFSSRKEIPILKAPDFGGILNALLSTTENVLNDVPKPLIKNMDEVVCFLASPWFASESRTIHEEYSKAEKITHKHIDALIKKLSDEFIVYSEGMYKEFLGGEVELMEVQSTRIKLNGYETIDPYGKLVNNLDINVFLSVSSKVVLKSLKEIVSRVLGHKKVSIQSFSLTLFVVLRDMFSEINNFTYIDVSGEMTDIGFVRDDVVEKVNMFPKGRNYVWRSCAKKWNTTELEAMSQSKLYFSGKVTPEVEKKVELQLSVVRKDWEKDFHTAARDVLGKKNMPRTVFLTADSDMRYWFAKVIEEGKLIRDLIGGVRAEVVVLNSKLLSQFCEFDPGVMKDPFLLIETIFINKSKP